MTVETREVILMQWRFSVIRDTGASADWRCLFNVMRHGHNIATWNSLTVWL